MIDSSHYILLLGVFKSILGIRIPNGEFFSLFVIDRSYLFEFFLCDLVSLLFIVCSDEGIFNWTITVLRLSDFILVHGEIILFLPIYGLRSWKTNGIVWELFFFFLTLNYSCFRFHDLFLVYFFIIFDFFLKFFE